MRFIEKPNLPKKDVRAVIVDKAIGESGKKLESLGISLIYSQEIKSFSPSIATHPDMQICHAGDNRFFVLDEVFEYYVNEFEKLGMQILCEKINKAGSENGILTYPRDCVLNVAATKDFAIGLKGNQILEKTDGMKVYTRQGYTKCSVIFVSDNAIITADQSIAKSSQNFEIDVCIVSNNAVRLCGYENGFIGGVAGKISKNKLAFCGNLELYDECEKIKNFCKKYDVECISLSSAPLYDYGSILPILEDS